ncbi:hypothetical protein JW964_05610 [candidate division KSB1 bacterium]|nr:hypothetical protein [candidate division KSB1 bacterium]
MKVLYLILILSICVFLFCGRPEKVIIKSSPEKEREEKIRYYGYTRQQENRKKIDSLDFAANPGLPMHEVVTRIRFEFIDQHVSNIPPSAEKSLESLYSYLIKPARNDFERVRAIYRWITTHIEYDIDASLHNEQSYIIPDEIFSERLAVCYGFSTLFKYFCNLAGLESIIIGGWARGRTGVEKIFSDDNLHAWNAVKIQNGWYLVDCTWGAGIFTNEGFVKQPADFYFLTEPNKLIYTHFPEIPKCQMLGELVKQEEFSRWPLVRNRFFEYNVDFPGNPDGTIEIEGLDSLSFVTPENIMLIARLKKDNQELDGYWTFAQRQNNFYRIHFKLPEPGKYTLGIYGRKKEQNNSNFSDLLWFNIKSGVSYKKSVKFPQTVESFQKRNVYLISPLQGQLVSGQTRFFKIRAPEALRVAAVNNDEWTFLKENSGTWEGTVVLKSGKLVLYANYVVGNRFEGLVVYEVK